MIYEDQTESGKTPRRNKTEINGIDSEGAKDSRQKSHNLLELHDYLKKLSANRSRIAVNPDFSRIGYGENSKHYARSVRHVFHDMEHDKKPAGTIRRVFVTARLTQVMRVR